MSRTPHRVALTALLLAFSLACTGGTEETVAPEPVPAAPAPEPEPEEPWCCAYDGPDGKVYVQTTDAKACTEKFAEQHGAYVKDAGCVDAKPDDGAAPVEPEPEPGEPEPTEPEEAEPEPAPAPATRPAPSGTKRGVGTTTSGSKRGVGSTRGSSSGKRGVDR